MIRLRKITKAMRRRRAKKTSPLAFLHSVERMRGILDRERMRADRGNSMFTLVTFTLPDSTSAEDLAQLGTIAQQRVRTTDEVGLLGPNCIGAILPETSTTGAWKLADDVCVKLPTAALRAACEVAVYVHPSDRGTPTPDEREKVKSQEETAPAEGALAGAGCTDADPRAAQAIQLMFVQGMPLWKRAIDVVVSATALLLLTPLFLVTAMAIKIASPGPVFFTQMRGGLGGRPFKIYKFRTMRVDAEACKAALLAMSEQDGPAFKLKNDPRVTRLGSFLRKTSIDELPQLINVLLGDMSLVGPRPLPCDESERCLPWQQRRLDVTPGLTCIWQVEGRSRVTFDEWARMDVRYIQSRSLVKDAKLIAQTLPAVVLRKGAC